MHGLLLIKLPCVARKSSNGHGILSLLKLQVEQDGNPDITAQQTFVVAQERVQTHVEQDQAASSLQSS